MSMFLINVLTIVVGIFCAEVLSGVVAYFVRRYTFNLAIKNVERLLQSDPNALSKLLGGKSLPPIDMKTFDGKVN